MPRVKRETQFDKLGRTIRGYATARELSVALGCSWNTAKAKLDSPEKLTLMDLTLINNRLHIPAEELKASIF